MGSILYAKLVGLRKNMIMMILMVIAPIIFTFMFGGMNSGEGKQYLPIVNEDNSIYAERLINELEKSNLYIVELVSQNQLEIKVRQRDAYFGLVIPEGFKDAVGQGKDSELVIYRSMETVDFYGFQGVLSSALSKVNLQSRITDKGIEAFEVLGIHDSKVENRIYSTVQNKWENHMPIQVDAKIYGDKQHAEISQLTHASLGFLIFFAMFPITFIIGDILEDKELLIWDRLTVSPISKTKIYSANLIFTFGFGMFQMVVLLLLNKIIFDLEWTVNIGATLMVISAFVFAVTSLGLFLSSFLKTHQQLSSVAPVVIVSTSMLGGLFWPVELITNKILLMMAKATPQFWTMEAMKKIVVYQNGIGDLLLPILVLILMGILFLGVGIQLKESR